MLVFLAAAIDSQSLPAFLLLLLGLRQQLIPGLVTTGGKLQVI